VTAYRRALDTFVMELDGVPRAVLKGAILPESDPAVQHDLANGEKLFAALDTSEDEKPPPAKSAPAKAEPEAEAKPVKDSPAPKAAAARGKM
jgi:hypothetical protein